MTLMIDLPLHGPCGHERTRDWKTVPAEIIHDLAPHLAEVATFAVHQNPECWGHGWRVSCVETGACISAADAGSREETLAKARAYLAGKTVAEVQARLLAFTPNAEVTGLGRNRRNDER